MSYIRSNYRWQCRYLDSCDLFRCRANNFRSMHLLCVVFSIYQLSWIERFGRYLLCLFLGLFWVKLLCCRNSLLQTEKKISQEISELETAHAHQIASSKIKAFYGVHASNQWESKVKTFACLPLLLPALLQSIPIHILEAIPNEMHTQPVGE